MIIKRCCLNDYIEATALSLGNSSSFLFYSFTLEVVYVPQGSNNPSRESKLYFSFVYYTCNLVSAKLIVSVLFQYFLLFVFVTNGIKVLDFMFCIFALMLSISFSLCCLLFEFDVTN